MKRLLTAAMALMLALGLTACASDKSDIHSDVLGVRDLAPEEARALIAPMELAAAYLSTQTAVSRAHLEALEDYMAGRGFSTQSQNIADGFIDAALPEDTSLEEFPIIREGSFKPTIYHEGVEIVSAQVESLRYTWKLDEGQQDVWTEDTATVTLGYTGDEPLLQNWSFAYVFHRRDDGTFAMTAGSGSYNIGGDGARVDLLPVELPLPEGVDAHDGDAVFDALFGA